MRQFLCVSVNNDHAFLENVLIHCLVGSSRSAAFAVAYMMTASGLDYWACMDALCALRPIANPNSNFRMQLRRYERTVSVLFHS